MLDSVFIVRVLSLRVVLIVRGRTQLDEAARDDRRLTLGALLRALLGALHRGGLLECDERLGGGDLGHLGTGDGHCYTFKGASKA